MDHRSGATRRGLLIVLSSPSGAGKSTIARMLLDADREVTMSISATTRAKRPGEADDVDYHFVDDAEFDRMITAGEFVEWAHVFGFRYGTPKAPVKDGAAPRPRHIVRHRLAGRAAARAGLRRASRHHLPPATSMTELEQRLHRRGTDSEDVIADRMRRAADEIDHWAEYEYVLVNRDMDGCLAQVRAIVTAERSKRVRQTDLVEFVRDLIGPAH